MSNTATEMAAAMEMVKTEGGVLREDRSDPRIRQLLLDHSDGLAAAVDQHKIGHSQDSKGWFYSLPDV